MNLIVGYYSSLEGEDGGDGGSKEKANSEGKCRFNLTMNIVYSIFESVLLVGFVFLTFQVYKKVKWNDKYMLAMLAFLQLHIMLNIVFYSMNAATYSPGLCNASDDNPTKKAITDWQLNIINYSSIIFLAISVLINCRNW